MTTLKTSHNKYIVLKTEDWDEIRLGIYPSPEAVAVVDAVKARILEGAEVIRMQDITAASIFYHYASALRGSIEIAAIIEEWVGMGLPVDRVKRLGEIADHFMDAAVEAENWPVKKLPD